MASRHRHDLVFASVLGTGRGPDATDTLLAARPTARSRVDLALTISDLKTEAGLRHALTIVCTQPRPRPFPERTPSPLLRDLESAVSGRLAEIALTGYGDTVRAYLQNVGVRSRLAHGILFSPSLRLHLWNESKSDGDLQCTRALSARLPRLVCGEHIRPTASAWAHALRGSWQEREQAHCRKCESLLTHCWEGVVDETEEDAGTLLPSWLQPLTRDFGFHILENAREQALMLPTLTDIVEACSCPLLPSFLTDVACELLDGQTEAVVKRVLGAETYIETAKDAEGGLGFVLGHEQWRDFFAASTPKPRIGTDLVGADAPIRQEIKADLVQRLRQRLRSSLATT